MRWAVFCVVAALTTSTASWACELVRPAPHLTGDAPVERTVVPAGGILWGVPLLGVDDTAVEMVHESGAVVTVEADDLLWFGHVEGVHLPLEWEAGTFFTVNGVDVVIAAADENDLAFPVVTDIEVDAEVQRVATGGCGLFQLPQTMEWVFWSTKVTFDDVDILDNDRLLVWVEGPNDDDVWTTLTPTSTWSARAFMNDAAVRLRSPMQDEYTPPVIRFVDSVTGAVSAPVLIDQNMEAVAALAEAKSGCTQASSTTWLGWLALLVCLRRRYRRTP